MLRWLAAGILCALGGCVDVCPSTAHTEKAFAPNLVFQDEIDACVEQRGCDRLCNRLFALDHGTDTNSRCSVDDRDVAVATGCVDDHGAGFGEAVVEFEDAGWYDDDGGFEDDRRDDDDGG